ncbi:hypothetical protein F5146DRAFT_483544 [Armillaria mellea]|nr:hypothetical protein F5146DRAFT_483544 [Armillaria mellea]
MPAPTPDMLCETCMKVVKNLNRHKKSHLSYSEREFRCPWAGCFFASAQKDGLKVHLNCIHTGEKPHVCPESKCGFATGDASRLTRHRKHVHKYSPAERENRNRRAVKVEDGSGDGAFKGYIVVGGAHAGPMSTHVARQRRPLVKKDEEELPIPALPFSFQNFVAPVYTPVAYDQPRVPVQHPMTVEYRFPASWAQAPVTQACHDTSIFKRFDAPYHNYAPTACYTCDAFYPSSQSHYESVVPRAFARQPDAAASQGPGSWSCPQAAGYVDYGYPEAGSRVRGGAQWAQALPSYGMDTSFESSVDGLIDSMARCDMSYY